MISAHFNGGLGNQMFQYACARSLADRLGTELVLDLGHFDDRPQYDFSLKLFRIRYENAAPGALPPDRKQQPLHYLIWRGLRRPPRLFREDGLSYNAAIEVLGDGIYLKGYWQSERYFAQNAANIRSDFQLKDPPDSRNAKLLAEIENAPAVSLHIRRGDYVSDAATNATHGTCSTDYYENAAAHIAEKAAVDPLIYVFSDDPAWVSAHLKLPFEMRFADHNDGSAGHEDLRLMGACRHHIIANSSFSWWGAWLNPAPDKIVVGPKRWFAHPKIHNADIVPDGWIRM